MKMVSDDIPFQLTPLAWKEMYTYYNHQSIKSKKELLEWLKKDERTIEWVNKISVKKNVGDKWGFNVRDLLIGYSLLDIGYYFNRIEYERNKMWRLFEDLVYEIFREILKKDKNCNIIRVDRWPGFKGLDYIIINDAIGDWNVGIQCKRYITTGISEKKLHKYDSYNRNTSTSNLIKTSENLKLRYRGKKLVLTTFDVYYSNKSQYNRYLKLKNKSNWNKIIVFNEIQNPITKYVLNCDGMDEILKWV